MAQTSNNTSRPYSPLEIIGVVISVIFAYWIGPAFIGFVIAIISGQPATIGLFFTKLDAAAGRVLVMLLVVALAAPILNPKMTIGNSCTGILIVFGIAYATALIFVCPVIFGKTVNVVDYLFYKDDYFASSAFMNSSAFLTSHGANEIIASMLIVGLAIMTVYGNIVTFAALIGVYREQKE